jgi:uncharacterized protein (TIGR03435 family)
MARLSDTLSRLLEAPVSDRTGVLGAFDFELQWSTEGDAADTTSAISVVLREQLGLKLERRLPVDFLVVDRAERPTED